ncbi:unnamed protein product [Prunus brigantina]
MGNAQQREPRPRSSSQANSQVTALTTKVAELQGQMSVILESLARLGFPIPQFAALTSDLIYPVEHGHQTSAPTSEPHLLDDHVDFGTLLD